MPRNRILIVEDEPNLRALLATVFRREGFEIVTARNGRVGVDMLHSATFDVAIVDLSMPRMTGIEMLRVLSSEDTLERTRVIVVSAALHDYTEDLSRLNICGTMAKPFNVLELVRLTHRCLDRV